MLDCAIRGVPWTGLQCIEYLDLGFRSCFWAVIPSWAIFHINDYRAAPGTFIFNAMLTLECIYREYKSAK